MLWRDNSNGFVDVRFHDFHMSCSSCSPDFVSEKQKWRLRNSLEIIFGPVQIALFTSTQFVVGAPAIMNVQPLLADPLAFKPG